jgi:hypothetical protein
MTKKLVIQSVREDGGRFRPSDWIERIAANMGEFGSDHRLHYSRTVHPQVVNGEKCLVIDPVLEQENPEAFQFILNFARSNQLKFQEV